jgi:hypothetical protein
VDDVDDRRYGHRKDGMEMHSYGIEALVEQRVEERQAEADRRRLAKAASAEAGSPRSWRIHLPTPTFHRPGAARVA